MNSASGQIPLVFISRTFEIMQIFTLENMCQKLCNKSIATTAKFRKVFLHFSSSQEWSMSPAVTRCVGLRSVYWARICKRLWGPGIDSSYSSFVARARIGKPLKEPRNRFPAWRNRFLGIDFWTPQTFTNTGSVGPVRLRQIGFSYRPARLGIYSWTP